jgi:hypothetical protein
MPKSRKTIKSEYHQRQLDAGRRAVQTYLPDDLVARLDLLARKDDITMREAYEQAVESFVTAYEEREAAALRAFFGGSPSPAGAVA